MDQLSLPSSSTSTLALSPDGAPIPVRWVEDLFERLAAILGGAMGNVYAAADPARVKAEWAEALAGFSADEVKRGLAATRTRRFAPNLPEFLHLCRPALDPELAWIEAEQGLAAHGRGELFAWSHPAVYWAGRNLSFEIRTSSFAQCRKRWERVMAEEWAKGVWCSPPDPRQSRLAAPSAAPSDPRVVQAARAKLAALRDRLTSGATPQQQDEALERAEAQALSDARTHLPAEVQP